MSEQPASEQPASRLRVQQQDYGWWIGFEDDALIDFHITDAVGTELLALQEAHPDSNYVISLDGVMGLSSAMLGKLITLYRRVKARERKLVLCEMGPIVEEMLRHSRLNTWFVCRGDRQAAEAEVQNAS